MMPATISIWLRLTALPPPPAPGPTDNADGGGLPLIGYAIGLLLVALVAGAGWWWRQRIRGRGARIASAGSLVPTAGPAFRIEHWHGGEAVVLDHAVDRDAGDAAVVRCATSLEAVQGQGSVVLIDDLTDELIALRPLDAAPTLAP